MPAPEIRGPSSCYVWQITVQYFGGPGNLASIGPYGPCTFIFHTSKFNTLVHVHLSGTRFQYSTKLEFSRGHLCNECVVLGNGVCFGVSVFLMFYLFCRLCDVVMLARSNEATMFVSTLRLLTKQARYLVGLF